mgnify:CR=1 FL=1
MHRKNVVACLADVLKVARSGIIEINFQVPWNVLSKEVLSEAGSWPRRHSRINYSASSFCMLKCNCKKKKKRQKCYRFKLTSRYHQDDVDGFFCLISFQRRNQKKRVSAGADEQERATPILSLSRHFYRLIYF